MSVKLLTEHLLEVLSLKGGCTGSFESTLVKMPHCWKSHATAPLYELYMFVLLLQFEKNPHSRQQDLFSFISVYTF